VRQPDGLLLASAKYVCTICCCVPKFKLGTFSAGAAASAPDGPMPTREYALEPDTCCCGFCVRCRCGGQGARCCRMPFLVRDIATKEPVDGGNGQVTDLWAGLAKASCTRQTQWQIKFPQGTVSDDPHLKSAMLAAALLIDLVVMEQEQQS
jgi:hypothetical protein